jgi:hypothetical protein
MANVTDIVRGLEIIQRYCHEGVQMGGAEHDIIYGPFLDRPMSVEDEAKLVEMGWFLDEEDDAWSHFC